MYALSLAENYILRFKIDDEADKLLKPSSFNFEEIEVRLSFAKAKFIISVGVGILIGITHAMVLLFS